MSSLSIGIVGLPNVGKSTLFNALTDSQILAANYPFATIEPNTAIAPVPDDRLGVLANMYKSKKVLPATVTFVDIAGLVAGASTGEGLGNQFLAHIRSSNAIMQVVRVFNDSNVLRHESSRDPQYDIEVVNTELVLADLQTLQKRLPKLEKEARANPKIDILSELYSNINAHLENGGPLWQNTDLLNAYHKDLSDIQLLTAKPILYVFNVDESGLSDKNECEKLAKLVNPAPCLFICAKLEDELRGLDESDRTEMLASYGQSELGLNQVIRSAYDLLGLQSYLTAGDMETRAWTIHKGFTAPQAAGVIHTDFEKGFIAAQVIDYNDLVAAGSEQAAKQAGRLRTEGKDYIMRPNDVVEFRFNVTK